MSGDHEGERDGGVQAREHTPQQVSHHSTVLVLTPTVVRMEVNFLLAEPMYFKEVVEHADDAVSTLARVKSLIDEVVDLTGQSLTAHSKNSTLSRSEEVHGTRLEGVVGVEHLLGHVKRIMGLDVSRAWCCFCCR